MVKLVNLARSPHEAGSDQALIAGYILGLVVRPCAITYSIGADILALFNQHTLVADAVCQETGPRMANIENPIENNARWQWNRKT